MIPVHLADQPVSSHFTAWSSMTTPHIDGIKSPCEEYYIDMQLRTRTLVRPVQPLIIHLQHPKPPTAVMTVKVTARARAL